MTADLPAGGDRAIATFEREQIESLDRLLWIYLKLLHARQALTKFLEGTPAERLEEDVRRLERRLQDDSAATLSPGEDDPAAIEARRRALIENVAASRERLANVARAKVDLATVRDELASLETKIHALGESSVGRIDAGVFRHETTAIVDGMRAAERTIDALRNVIGLEERTAPPKMLETESP
ncbi:MAG: hypothetical protein QM811_04670 [Pirellulales bacterium]